MTQTYTKLMTAAWRNSSEEVKQLIAQGSDVNEKNETGVPGWQNETCPLLYFGGKNE